MTSRSLFVLPGFIVVAGCTAAPPQPKYDGIEVEKIVDAVQCELASVYARNPEYAGAVRDWLARAVLDLKVIYDASFVPTVTVIPVVSSGTLKVPIGPDFRDETVRTASITFDIHMRELAPDFKPRSGVSLPRCTEYTGLPEAYGSLGLAEWVSTIATSAGRRDFAALNAAAYNLEFTIERGVHGGVSFVNAHVDVSATAGSTKKTNNNHLVVGFTSDPVPIVTKRGKARASPAADDRLNMEIQRFLPQRFNLQPGSGITIR